MPLDQALAIRSPRDCGGFELANAAERLYRKQLAYVGQFVKSTAGGDQPFEITEADIDHWALTHDELTAAGIEVPLPIEHTTDPEKRRGTVVKIEKGLDSKGRQSLFMLSRFRDAEAEKLASTANVSIYVPPSFKDGKGRVFTRPIRHVALTDYPVIPELDGFQTIAASFVGELSMAIDWSAIQTALDLPEGVELTDANAVEVILTAIAAMKAKPGEEKKPDEKAGDKPGEKPGEKPAGTPPAATPPAPKPIAASFVRMLKDNRSLKLDRLMAEGKLVKAARDKIEKEHLSDGSLALSLESENGEVAFDSLIATLSALPPCVPLKERTGAQVLALSNPGGANEDDKKGSVVKAMEARVKAAEARRPVRQR